MDNGVGNRMHWADTRSIEHISCLVPWKNFNETGQKYSPCQSKELKRFPRSEVKVKVQVIASLGSN